MTDLKWVIDEADWIFRSKEYTSSTAYQKWIEVKAKLDAHLKEDAERYARSQNAMLEVQAELAVTREDRDAWRDGYNRQHLLYDDTRRQLDEWKKRLAHAETQGRRIEMLQDELAELRAAAYAFLNERSQAAQRRLRQFIEEDKETR